MGYISRSILKVGGCLWLGILAQSCEYLPLPMDVLPSSTPVLEPASNTPPPGSEGKFSAVAAGTQHTCVVLQESLKCWGLNRYGEIGNGESGLASETGSTPGSGAPKLVLRPHTVFSDEVSGVAVGYEHTCAIHQGALKCFGSNEYSQLGLEPDIKVQAVPALVLNEVVQVAAKGHWTCAVTQSRELYCWGSRWMFENGLPVGKRVAARPTRVALTDVTSVSLSPTHACAIASGDLHCWGTNAAGEVGNGDSTAVDFQVPQKVLSGEVQEVRVADGRSCARVGGKLKCFGMSLGDRESDRNRTSKWNALERTPYDATFWDGLAPLQRSSARGAVIAQSQLYHGSYYHNDGKPRLVARGVVDLDISEMDLGGCMLFRGLQVYCWGPNLFGQLGTGAIGGADLPIHRATPVTF